MAPSLILALLIPLSPFIYTLIRLIIRQCRSPLRHLPGPPSPSLFMGNLQQIHDQENTNIIAHWVSQYGPTFVYRGFLGGRRLITTDPVAVAHILSNANQYPKPDFIRDALAAMAAGQDGLLTVEGDNHQRQVLLPFSLFCTYTNCLSQRRILVSDNLYTTSQAAHSARRLPSPFLISNPLHLYSGKKHHRYPSLSILNLLTHFFIVARYLAATTTQRHRTTSLSNTC